MKKLIMIACLGMLAACGTLVPQEPKVVTQTVNIPVPIHCKPDLGPAPDYPDTPAALANRPHPGATKRLQANPADEQAMLDLMENITYELKLYIQGRLLRIQREKELTAALQACQ